MSTEESVSIAAAGVDFNAQRSGASPKVIFIHGFGEDLHSWDLLWPELASRLSALRYDLRGYGKSVDSATESFSHTDDLLALLDAQGIRQCSLVGISMGGAIALNFALNFPDRVEKLVLISPGMVAWEWSEAWRQLWGAVAAEARAGNLDEARQLWWQHPFFASTRNSPAAKLLHDSIMRFSGDQWIQDRQESALPDIDRLYTLKPATLLLSAAKDFEDFRLIADVLDASTDKVTRIDHADLGHLLHLEDPQGCAREILHFLQD